MDIPERPLGDTHIQEGLTAIRHANGRDWWIFCRKGTVSSDTIVSILLTPNGVESINYYSAPLSSSWIVNMKASNGGNLLVEATLTDRKINLYNFNRCTGSFQHRSTFDSPDGLSLYGLAFSPNDKYIYVGSADWPARLYQVEIKEDTIHDYRTIGQYNGGRYYMQMLLGSDGKIYCIQQVIPSLVGWQHWFAAHLGVIHNPDEGGMACEYDPTGLYLNGYYLFGGGFPNHPNYDLGPLRGSICDSLPDPVIASVPVQAFLDVFSVNAYPNPASGTLMLSATGGTLSDVRVFNAMGQLQLRLDDASQHQPVSVGDWPPGIYTIVARAISGALSKEQVVIQR